MSTNHTPGPWNVDGAGSLRVLASDDRQTIVCEGIGPNSNPASLADARLIAAAPELLEAIQEYFVVWANEGKKNGWCKRVTAAREKVNAAIAKATGEEAP